MLPTMYISFTQIAPAVKIITNPAISFLSIVFNRFHIIVVVYKIATESAVARCAVRILCDFYLKFIISFISAILEFKTAKHFLHCNSFGNSLKYETFSDTLTGKKVRL
jgi:hypothetical protein